MSNETNPYGFAPGRLAEFDQWFANTSRLIDELIANARIDIGNGQPVSRAEEAALLTGALQGNPGASIAFLSDLLAVMLVRTIRPIDASPKGDPQP